MKLFVVVAVVVLAALAVVGTDGANAARNGRSGQEEVEQPEPEEPEATSPEAEEPEATSAPPNPSQQPNSTEPSPTSPAPPNRPPQEGDSCDHERCVNQGYCQSYLRCDKDTGRLVREHCGVGLVWNPLHPNGTKHIHGGNCDTWENLDQGTERSYRTDPECLACFWRETGECQRDYLYQPPNQRHRNVITMTCADGLVFSQAKETCQLCSDVLRGDGSPCCGSGGNSTTPATTTTGVATPEP